MTDYAVIYEQADDGGWSARAADLPAYAAGDTREEAEANLREAMALQLDYLREQGRTVPAPRSVVGMVSV